MTRSSENRCFRRFRQTRDPRLLAKVFDATAAELLRVAGHLSNGDRELAQDALQATFLTAIEKADAYDAERDVRPWLLGILANHVRKERRRTVRQRGLDAAAMEPEEQGSTVARVQAAEFGSAASAAMQQLPSPFKEVVVLHLQHGLTAAEIGAALGRPAGTVRTQIVRGLDRLRALLPAGFTAAALGMMLTPGPILAAVRSNVLAALPPVAVASSSLVVSGRRLYAMMAAGLTLVLAVLFAWLPSSGVAPPAAAADLGEVSASVVAPDAASERVLVATGPARMDPPSTAEERPQGPGNRQRVVLDLVYKRDGSGAGNVQVGMRVDGHVKSFDADANGRCELWLPWPGIHELYVIGTNARTAFMWHAGERRVPVQKRRVEIDAGMDLDVRVTDTDGKPIAGATVECSHGNQIGHGFLMGIGKTDASGRLRRREVPLSGQMRVWAPGYRVGRIRNVHGKLGEVVEACWQLQPGAGQVRGTVVDENGRPIGGAELALVPYNRAPYLPQFSQSNGLGQFAFQTLEKGRHVLVGMRNDGTMRRGLLPFVHDGVVDREVELRLTTGAKVVGVLRGPNGQLLAGTDVVARHRPEGLEPLPFLASWTRTARDGSFVLSGLAPSDYRLEVDKVPPQQVTLRAGEIFQWNPARPKLVPVSFRLLGPDAQPLQGWSVSLVPPDSEFERSRVITGADGRALHAPSDWRFASGSFCRFNVYRKLGHDMSVWQDHSRQPSLRTPPLLVGGEHEIRLTAAAMALHNIVGTVLDKDGAVLSSAEVKMAGTLGWSSPMVAAVDPGTGGFRFEDLPPGRYRAKVYVPGMPTLTLPPLDVAGAKIASFGEVKMPDVGRVIVTLPAASISARDLSLFLVNSIGAKHRLRGQPDGSWRSGLLHHGGYELRGWSEQAWVPPQALKLSGATVTVGATAKPHTPTKVVVMLPPAHSRSGNSWVGTLTAHVGGKVVADRKLRYSFDSGFAGRMEFSLPLPAGDLSLRVKSWDQSAGSVRTRVGASGGGQALVRLR